MSGLLRRVPGRAAALAAGAGTCLGAAATARLTQEVLRRTQPLGRGTWERTNHAGLTVTLLEGPAWALGAAAPLATCPATAPGAFAVLGSAALGALDDHVGTTTVKGLRGHLGALRRGRVTTGAVKVVGLATTGAVTAWLVDAGQDDAGRDPVRPAARVPAVLLGGALVAGSANLVNLLDLRPGRALKAVVLVAPAAGAGSARAAALAGAAAGAALALLPQDLAGRSMLGDTGANAAGALLGTAVLAGRRTPGRLVALTGVAALVLASERVSFTQVIADHPVLDALDRWGRPA